jgi:hypothetical protein
VLEKTYHAMCCFAGTHGASIHHYTGGTKSMVWVLYINPNGMNVMQRRWLNIISGDNTFWLRDIYVRLIVSQTSIAIHPVNQGQGQGRPHLARRYIFDTVHYR